MIGIIDYGVGNIVSLQNTLQRIGYSSLVSGDPTELDAMSHLILPGVGAFGDAVAQLERTGLGDYLKRVTAEGKPLIGICLGMQVLFESGDEGGNHAGLGLLTGRVTRLPASDKKVPHMGWNTITAGSDGQLGQVSLPAYVYFVHSYYATGVPAEQCVASCDYGVQVPAIVRRQHVVGLQFHPEKSGAVGAALLNDILGGRL